MNEYDSNRIYDLTKKINYFKTENLDEANCYVLNTCHIREKATDKVYHDIGRLKKQFRKKTKLNDRLIEYTMEFELAADYINNVR